MNKKVLLIPIAIGLLVWGIYEMSHSVDTGNKFEMTIPQLADDAAAKEIKKFNLYLDNSGSMKGYVDFAGLKEGATAKASIIGDLSNLMDNVYSIYGIEPKCDCGGSSYLRPAFLKGMENFSIFKGAVTELHKMIQSVCKATADTSVSVIATDMIMSYGKSTLMAKKDNFYNYHQLSQLGAQIYNAMTECKNKNLDVLLLQYYSDFNGKYYCNYTENIVANPYKDTLMTERPYYLLVIGSKANLKSLMANKCFNAHKHVYASFGMDEGAVMTQSYSVEMEKSCRVGWLIGDERNPDNAGSIATTTSFGSERSTIYFTCKRFEIPGYISLNDNYELVSSWDEEVIEEVEEVSDPGDAGQKFRVALKAHNTLKTKSDVWVKLNSDNSWSNEASCEDDTEGEISRKTWGLSTVLTNINKAYHGAEAPDIQTIAEFKLNLFIE